RRRQSPATGSAAASYLCLTAGRVTIGRAGPRERVALAADGHDDARLVRVVAQLLAQAGDVHVDGARLPAARVDPPHPRQDLVARDGAAGVLCQVAQQLHLLLRQLDPRAVVEARLAAPQVGDAPGER